MLGRVTLLPALFAAQDILVFDRLLLILSFVVGPFLSLALPFGCTCRTEPAPGRKRPTTTATGNVFRFYWLRHSCRPSGFELVEQVEAVLFVLMPAPMLCAYLQAYPFSQWPPPQKRQALTSFHIA